MADPILQSITNYLVPATNSPNAYTFYQSFSATPYLVDFSQLGLNGLPFRPSGMIIDNTQGAGDLNVLIPQMSFNVTCKAGKTLMMPYPAPVNHTASITGDGMATVIFVDFPLIPYSSSQAEGSTAMTDAEFTAHFVNDQDNTPSLPVLTGIPNNLYTPTFTVATGAGYTGLANSNLIFINTGTTDVTVGGAILPAGQRVEMYAPPYVTFNHVSYDATGGSLFIAQI